MAKLRVQPACSSLKSSQTDDLYHTSVNSESQTLKANTDLILEGDHSLIPRIIAVNARARTWPSELINFMGVNANYEILHLE